MTPKLIKLFNQLRRNLQTSSKTAEEALKEAKSWQIVLALLFSATVGTYLAIVAIGPTAIALAQTFSKSLPIVSGAGSIILLVEFYMLAWLTFALLDMSKDFTKELHHRMFGL